MDFLGIVFNPLQDAFDCCYLEYAGLNQLLLIQSCQTVRVQRIVSPYRSAFC